MASSLPHLQRFYGSPRGAVAARAVRAALTDLWPDLRGMSVLGLGYAPPYLRLWRSQAARCAAVMHPEHGPLRWPRHAPGVALLADEVALPFPDRSFDRVLMVHALENAESARRAMREVWRVLADGGRLVVVVPNRRGMWAHLEGTPFGHGRPYSPGQLDRLLDQQLFTVRARRAVLFVPPFASRLLLRTAPAWDAVGGTLFHGFCGVVLAEAEKEVAAPLLTTETAQVRRTVAVGETAR
jgi:SAM-dependent methyltransferase